VDLQRAEVPGNLQVTSGEDVTWPLARLNRGSRWIHLGNPGKEFLLAITLLLAGCSAAAPSATNMSVAMTTNATVLTATNTTPVRTTEAAENAWSFSASVYTHIVPEGDDYAQPTIAADRGWLHLEARYNYEALKTGSIWVGHNFAGGDKVAWEFTPMLGGVFGDINGIAPGYKGSVSWWKLQLYSEGEYLLDTGDFSASFFYNWSELTLAPVDWFRFGFVTQRTSVSRTDRDIQLGALVGFSWSKNNKAVDVTTYVFNLDESKPTVVVAVGVRF
jgi:hypothetical protein